MKIINQSAALVSFDEEEGSSSDAEETNSQTDSTEDRWSNAGLRHLHIWRQKDTFSSTSGDMKLSLHIWRHKWVVVSHHRTWPVDGPGPDVPPCSCRCLPALGWTQGWRTGWRFRRCWGRERSCWILQWRSPGSWSRRTSLEQDRNQSHDRWASSSLPVPRRLWGRSCDWKEDLKREKLLLESLSWRTSLTFRIHSGFWFGASDKPCCPRSPDLHPPGSPETWRSRVLLLKPTSTSGVCE